MNNEDIQDPSDPIELEDLLWSDSAATSEPIREKSSAVRGLQILGALLAITGLLYLSGIYEYFFFKRTPAGIVQEPTGEHKGEVITVFLKAVIFSGETAGGSGRAEDEIVGLVKNASNIWAQAGISLSLLSTETKALTAEELRTLRRDPVSFVSFYELPTTGAVMLYLSHDLGGINGVAFGESGKIALADHTAGFDFRVLAHEVGHALGLGHTNNLQDLMYSGSGGVNLDTREIELARQNAVVFSGE